MIAKDLFLFAESNVPSVVIKFSTQAEYQSEAERLEQRFSTGKTVKGTQRLHSFIPVSLTSLDTKELSSSEESRRVKVTGDMSSELDLSEIRGFVTATWNGQWFLASVMSVDTILGDVRLSFLRPPGPAVNFSFPPCPDIGIIPSSAVLSCVDPLMSGSSGRAYKLSKKEIDMANKCLMEKKH